MNTKKPARSGEANRTVSERTRHALNLRRSWEAERTIDSSSGQEHEAIKLGRRLRPDDLVFEQLARLARVHTTRVEALRLAISSQLDREWWRHWNKPKEIKSSRKRGLSQLKCLEKHSVQIHTILRDLDPYALGQFILGFALALKESDGPPSSFDLSGGVVRYKELAAMFAKASSDALRAHRFKWPRRRRGRRAGLSSLDRYTLSLLWSMESVGGRLTLDKNLSEGTLIDVLKLLRPFLPPGIVPNKLSAATLARIKALDKKTARRS